MSSQSSAVRLVKRAIDIAAAGVGVALTLPLYPLIALAIYVDDPGPIFYRQRRAGKILDRSGVNGFRFEEFDMLKFRSMRVDAEKLTGAVLAGENDPRVTRVGRFLRKTRLDELPQMFNVLRGEMSLVGPRPERPELLSNLALLIPFFEERMRNVKPGITGLAQVSLGYTGRPSDGNGLNAYIDTLINPYKLDGCDGALADDMRIKLLYDLAYVAGLERFPTFLRNELSVIAKTPMVMAAGVGR
jgi:lipopolysaccharide/colanic/teichoic acid biosynthesis glycosyltransferase